MSEKEIVNLIISIIVPLLSLLTIILIYVAWVRDGKTIKKLKDENRKLKTQLEEHSKNLPPSCFISATRAEQEASRKGQWEAYYRILGRGGDSEDVYYGIFPTKLIALSETAKLLGFEDGTLIHIPEDQNVLTVSRFFGFDTETGARITQAQIIVKKIE